MSEVGDEVEGVGGMDGWMDGWRGVVTWDGWDGMGGIGGMGWDGDIIMTYGLGNGMDSSCVTRVLQYWFFFFFIGNYT